MQPTWFSNAYYDESGHPNNLFSCLSHQHQRQPHKRQWSFSVCQVLPTKPCNHYYHWTITQLSFELANYTIALVSLVKHYLWARFILTRIKHTIFCTKEFLRFHIDYAFAEKTTTKNFTAQFETISCCFKKAAVLTMYPIKRPRAFCFYCTLNWNFDI